VDFMSPFFVSFPKHTDPLWVSFSLDKSPPSSSEVVSAFGYTSTPPYVSIAFAFLTAGISKQSRILFVLGSLADILEYYFRV
jgi:hypothetical protein